MPHATDYATACVLNGRLFVAGGYDCGKLQVWDGTAWTLKADLPAARFGAASAVHDGKVMVIGGAVNNQETASVIVYNPESDTWAAAEPLPAPRSGCPCSKTCPPC